MGPGGYQLGTLAPRSVVWSQNLGQTQINWGLLVNQQMEFWGVFLMGGMMIYISGMHIIYNSGEQPISCLFFFLVF